MKILNTRELQSRIDELELERQDWIDNLTEEEKQEIADNWELPSTSDCDLEEEWKQTKAEGDEYTNLLVLKDEIGSEWQYGVSLVPEIDFEEFAKEEAESLDLVKHGCNWPYNCIDWEKAANELKQDYSTVDFEGETYYYWA